MSPNENKQFEKIHLLLTEKTKSLDNQKIEQKSYSDNYKNKFTKLCLDKDKTMSIPNSAYKDLKKTKNENKTKEKEDLLLAFENEYNLTKSKTYFGFSEKVVKYYESERTIKNILIKAKIGSIIEELSNDEKKPGIIINEHNLHNINEKDIVKTDLLSKVLNLNNNISNNDNKNKEISGQNISKNEIIKSFEKKENSQIDLLPILPNKSENESNKNQSYLKEVNKNTTIIHTSGEQDLGETKYKLINDSTVVNTLPSFSSDRKGKEKRKLINIFKDEMDEILSLVEDLKRSKFINKDSKRK
jgi:hypothetical protein